MADCARIVGVDPGLATLGVAVVEVRDTGASVESMRTFRTSTEAKKRRLRVADENTERLERQLQRVMWAIGYRPAEAAVLPDVIVAESMSFPRSSSAAAKMALVWGALVMFATEHNVPIVQLTPQEIKQSVAGSKSASKSDIEIALSSIYGVTRDSVLDHTDQRVPASAQEHAWDALGAIHAALDTPTVKVAVRMATRFGATS